MFLYRKHTNKPLKSFYSKIVSAAIHPAIGVCRIGNSDSGFYVAPETTNETPGSLKDSEGKLKRQVQRFRIYGYDENGNVVKELTEDTQTKIDWSVHVANKKAAWFEFVFAMDIPEAPQSVPLRNSNIKDRSKLIIDAGLIKISGKNQQGKQFEFGSGKFFDTNVYLGEARTDEQGRLLMFGGRGLSRSAYANGHPSTFANNNGWHDDVSDGPINAKVVLDGQAIPVKGSWVITGPPNYAQEVVSVTNLYDTILATNTKGLISLNQVVNKSSLFLDIVYPILKRLADHQWVNKGFATLFGYGGPYNFTSLAWRSKLSNNSESFRQVRNNIFNMFNSPSLTDPFGQKSQIVVGWPPYYGDHMDSLFTDKLDTEALMPLSTVQYSALRKWRDGEFDAPSQEWLKDPENYQVKKFAEMNPSEQAKSLDKAALWYCLGGPFHPGCEVTWPMRHLSLYSEAFRIRQRDPKDVEPDYGSTLTKDAIQGDSADKNPLFAQGPGDLTKWMAVPWQTDTASCQSGYQKDYDPYLPTFWAARVPNQVLTKEDYEKLMDPKLSKEKRLESFLNRRDWLQALNPKTYLPEIDTMINNFDKLGSIEKVSGPKDLTDDIPSTLYVETGVESIQRDNSFDSKRFGKKLRGYTHIDPEFDIGIVGGGPSGSAAAILLSNKYKVVQVYLEKEPFKVGDSLPPQSKPMLKRLGILEMVDSDNVRSYGTDAAWGSSQLMHNSFVGDVNGYGWHLDRSEFEKMMRSVARQNGGHMRQEEILKFENMESEWILTSDKSTMNCKILIDATGRRSRVAKFCKVERLKLDHLGSIVKIISRPMNDNGSTIIESNAYGWWYSAPITKTERHVSFQTDTDLPCFHLYLKQFDSLLSKTLHLNQYSSCNSTYFGTFPVNSSIAKSMYGQNWALVGDACMTVDPLSSQGIMNSLYSGILLASNITQLDLYEKGMYDVFDQYLTHKFQYYQIEQRFQTPFWQRRN